MPIYQTCASNQRIPDISPAGDRIQHAAVLRWLCVASNRVSLDGSPSAFLDDVHDAYHDRGYLTDLQARGVERWMSRQQREGRRRPTNADIAESSRIAQEADITFEVIGRGTAAIDENENISVVTAPVDPRIAAYEGVFDIVGRWDGTTSTRGATWNQAEWVYNGEFSVRYGTTIMYRIHTITSSRSSQSLVGKRSISVYQNERWVPFAFVSVTGHLSLWSRFEDRAGEPFVRAAEILLESFRDEDRFRQTRWLCRGPHGASYRVDWHVHSCRNCNRDMRLDNSDDREQGVHDRDCIRDRVSALNTDYESSGTPLAHRERSQRSRPVRRTEHAAGFVPPAPVVTTPTMSELGTGWIQ